jgi:hypothetical protein
MEEDPNFDYLYLSRSVGLWFDRLRLAVLIKDEQIGDTLRVAMTDYVERLIFPE